MANVQSKFTIHPWLDAPLYNRIRYPQWKLYLTMLPRKCAPQWTCTSMDLTGAFSLVALQQDRETHLKNIIPGTPATALVATVPASIRQRPIVAMPALYTREMYKLEKERFGKIDEAETALHAAIVESLSPGTVRATPSGIASLPATQLVGLVHTLFRFRTPTPQDINTVNTDLLRPLQNFEDFPDHRAHQPLRF
jgi:hypothetical protein